MIRVTEVKLVDRLFLLGPPGVGKTEVIRQKAEEEAEKMGRVFVDLREAEDLAAVEQNPNRYYVYLRVVAPHVFPEDLGIPRFERGYVEFLPPRVLRILTLRGVAGVLFVDEITNVQRDDQLSMYYSLVLEKEFSWSLKLAPDIKVVLAGNPSEWSELSRPVPKPLRNRLIIVYVSAPTVDEWIDYMYRKHGDRWERLTAAYLKTHPGDFLKPPPEGDDFSAFPTPRSWTRVATELWEHSGGFAEEVIEGNLGREVGHRFLSLWRLGVDAKSILEKARRDPESFRSLSLNLKLVAINALSQVDDFTQYGKFVKWLAQHDREMFVLTLLLMDRERRADFAVHYAAELGDVVGELARYI